MKLLLDAHLPPVLARVMRERSYKVEHVLELGLSTASDIDIWSYAVTNGCVVVSKAEDFRRFLSGPKSAARFIWVRTGNCKNRELVSTVMRGLPAALSLLESGSSMVEVLRE